VTVYSYQSEGSVAVAEAATVGGIGGAWFVLEEGVWCMKPVKMENMKSVVRWREKKEYVRCE